jgi:hypothetical protein
MTRRRAHLVVHGAEAARRTRRPRHEHDVRAGGEGDVSGSFAQQSLRAVALHGTTDPSRRHHGDASATIVVTASDVDHREAAGPLVTGAQHRADIAAGAEPIVSDRGHDGQADSFARPRRRRFLTTARPERVRIRERNPCLRARRRLFGWKVRFTTEPSPLVVGARNAGRWCRSCTSERLGEEPGRGEDPLSSDGPDGRLQHTLVRAVARGYPGARGPGNREAVARTRPVRTRAAWRSRRARLGGSRRGWCGRCAALSNGSSPHGDDRVAAGGRCADRAVAVR